MANFSVRFDQRHFCSSGAHRPIIRCRSKWRCFSRCLSVFVGMPFCWFPAIRSSSRWTVFSCGPVPLLRRSSQSRNILSGLLTLRTKLWVGELEVSRLLRVLFEATAPTRRCLPLPHPESFPSQILLVTRKLANATSLNLKKRVDGFQLHWC